MRLLWITEHYAPGYGGMARSCDRIVHGLRSAGEVEIDLVHLVAGAQPNADPETWRAVQLGGRERRWPVGDERAHDLRVLAACLQREGSARGSDWDVVVAFGGTLPILLAPMLARWLGVPSMTLLRGNDFDTAIFSTRRQTPLLTGLGASSLVCPVTEAMAEHVRTILPDQKVEAVANGIDVEAWPRLSSAEEAAAEWRRSRQIGEDQVVIGLVGQLKRKKGADRWIDALAQSGEKVHLMVLGTLDAAVNAALVRHHNQLSYSRYPAVAPGALIPCYLRCDFIAIPSLYDGMPNVLLEAGALGLPVIGADSGGMPEVVRDGEDGFLFDPFDGESVKAAIGSAAGGPRAERERMGQHLRARIESEFSAARERQNYQRLLKGLIP